MNEQDQPLDLNSYPSFQLSFLWPRYWIVWIGLSLFYVLSWLPVSWLDLLADRLGDLAMKKNRKRNHIARTNLRLCYPECDEEQVSSMLTAHFRSQARAALEYAQLWWHQKRMMKERVVLEGVESIEEARRQGSNIVIMLCHSVFLDVAVSALSERFSSCGLYKSFRNPIINWLIARSRTRFGLQAFTREEGFRPIIRSVKAGSILLYPGDEDLGAERCVFAPFFGHLKATVPVFGRLVRSTQSKAFTCMVCYDSQQSKFIVHILPIDEPLSGEDDIADATVMNRSIEQAVDICPVYYMWTLRLFKTRPDESKSPYER